MPSSSDDAPAPFPSRRPLQGVPQRSGKLVLGVIFALVVVIVTAVVLIGLHRP